ncbi:MAG: glycosyltransferase family 39 protein, partial [Acidobacteriota bacterium]
MALGTLVASRLAKLGNVPEGPGPYALALLGAFLLAAAAGWLSRRPEPPGSEPIPPLAPAPGWARALAGAAALGLSVWTFFLQRRFEIPLWALAVWAAAVALVPLAFSRTAPRPRRWSPALLLACAALLAVGASARLMALSRIHPVRAGDENAVTMDGLGQIWRDPNDDPFGMGAQSCAHLSMLPAGIGYLLGSDPIGSPRVPYGIIGTAALVAAAGAAAVAGGPEAALFALALLVLQPQHIHWSRMSDLVVVDSVTVVAAVLAMLMAYRRGSPRSACFAGIFSGLTFYGYTGGRIMVVVALFFLPVLAWGARAVRPRRAWVLAALTAGFLVAAAPSIHYATKRFDEWNGRYNKTSVFFDKEWLPEEVKTQGSVWAVGLNQLRLGTIGLLSAPSTIHYVGYPMIAPSILPALGIAGLAWLLGRGLLAEAYLFGLVVAGNLAVTCLSLSTPQPQRGSSLLSTLAILGGIAAAGFVSLFPQ